MDAEALIQVARLLNGEEAFQFLLATAMHEGGDPRFGKLEFLN